MTTDSSTTTEKESTTKRLLHDATPSGYFSHFDSTAGKWAMAIFYPFVAACELALVLAWWVLFAVIWVLVLPFRVYGRVTKRGHFAPTAPKTQD